MHWSGIALAIGEARYAGCDSIASESVPLSFPKDNLGVCASASSSLRSQTVDAALGTVRVPSEPAPDGIIVGEGVLDREERGGEGPRDVMRQERNQPENTERLGDYLYRVSERAFELETWLGDGGKSCCVSPPFPLVSLLSPMFIPLASVALLSPMPMPSPSLPHSPPSSCCSPQRVPARVSRGRALMWMLRDQLHTIELSYGVPKEVLVAVWGLESDFGAFSGDHPVLESLLHLAYLSEDGERAGFFREEAIIALRILEGGLVGVEVRRGPREEGVVDHAVAKWPDDPACHTEWWTAAASAAPCR